jgi:hypothetical protein
MHIDVHMTTTMEIPDRKVRETWDAYLKKLAKVLSRVTISEETMRNIFRYQVFTDNSVEFYEAVQFDIPSQAFACELAGFTIHAWVDKGKAIVVYS